MAGFCLVHDPEQAQDMRELGRKGGSVRPSTKMRQAVDEDLREQARETLSRALAGEDVPKQALDAARSLFAYRPAEAPRGQALEQQHEGRGVFSLESLLRTAVETGVVGVVDGQVAIAGVPVEITHTPLPRKNRAPESITSCSSAPRGSL